MKKKETLYGQLKNADHKDPAKIIAYMDGAEESLGREEMSDEVLADLRETSALLDGIIGDSAWSEDELGAVLLHPFMGRLEALDVWLTRMQIIADWETACSLDGRLPAIRHELMALAEKWHKKGWTVIARYSDASADSDEPGGGPIEDEHILPFDRNNGGKGDGNIVMFPEPIALEKAKGDAPVNVLADRPGDPGWPQGPDDTDSLDDEEGQDDYIVYAWEPEDDDTFTTEVMDVLEAAQYSFGTVDLVALDKDDLPQECVVLAFTGDTIVCPYGTIPDGERFLKIQAKGIDLAPIVK